MPDPTTRRAAPPAARTAALSAVLVLAQVALAALAIDGWAGGSPGPSGPWCAFLVLGIAGLVLLRRAWCLTVPLRVRDYRRAFVLLACTVLLFQVVAAPFHGGTAFGMLALALVLHGALGAWTATRPAGPRRRGVRVAGFVLFQLLVGLFGVELGLRAVAHRHPSVLLLRADAAVDEQIAAYHYRPGQVHLGFPCDSAGYYDEAPGTPGEETRLVLAVGDSFNASTVPQPYHYTTVCERALAQVEVYNAGVSAAGPREYQRMIETLEGLRPDAILLCLFVGNDITDAQRGRRSLPWLRSWLDRDDSVLFGLVQRRRLAHGVAPAEPAATRLTLDGDRVVVQTGHGTLEGTRAQLMDLYPILYPWIEDPSQETPTFPRDQFLDLEQRRAEAICSPPGRTYADFFAALEELLAACEGTPTLVLMIPDQFQVDEALWADLTARSGASPLDRDQPQRLWKEHLDRRGIPALDLLPAFREAMRAEPGRSLYLRQDTHFNAAGHRLAGALLADFLREVLSP